MRYQAMSPINLQQNSASFRSRIGYSHPTRGAEASDKLSTSETSNISQSSGWKGTIDGVDQFCKEGTVKAAVEYVAVDLHRYLHWTQACGEGRNLREPRLVHHHVA